MLEMLYELEGLVLTRLGKERAWDRAVENWVRVYAGWRLWRMCLGEILLALLATPFRCLHGENAGLLGVP